MSSDLLTKQGVLHAAAGFTAPGEFLFELLGRLGITGESVYPLLRLMDAASEVLADDGAAKGRKCAPMPCVRPCSCSHL